MQSSHEISIIALATSSHRALQTAFTMIQQNAWILKNQDKTIRINTSRIPTNTELRIQQLFQPRDHCLDFTTGCDDKPAMHDISHDSFSQWVERGEQFALPQLAHSCNMQASLSDTEARRAQNVTNSASHTVATQPNWTHEAYLSFKSTPNQEVSPPQSPQNASKK